jgi:2,4-dienoyl-CoA reductase-like NADH-dependent reductase (Old Yellow Enzyme family)
MSNLDTSILFRPFSIRSLELKNRIVMAPMTRQFFRRRASPAKGALLTTGGGQRVRSG